MLELFIAISCVLLVSTVMIYGEYRKLKSRK